MEKFQYFLLPLHTQPPQTHFIPYLSVHVDGKTPPFSTPSYTTHSRVGLWGDRSVPPKKKIVVVSYTNPNVFFIYVKVNESHTSVKGSLINYGKSVLNNLLTDRGVSSPSSSTTRPESLRYSECRSDSIRLMFDVWSTYKFD